MIPGIFVVGFPKCGTTSLYNFLKISSNIITGRVKESHYFSKDEVIKSYYGVNPVKTEEDYLSQFSNSKGKIIVDVCPSYGSYESSLLKIKKFNPRAKLVYLTRNPVERAISHYLMDFNKGYIKESLNSIISRYNNGERDEVIFQIIELGFYNEFINSAKKNFKEKDIFEINLFDATQDNLKNLNNFIGSDFISQELLRLRFNEAFIPKYNFIKTMRSSKLIFSLYQKIASENVKDKVRLLLSKKNSKKPDLLIEKRRLNDIYFS